MKLLVNNFEVGEYEVLMSEWDINLKQKVYVEDSKINYDIIQVIYYNPDWCEFFAIYALIDEYGDTEFYLIDSKKISEDAKEYNAVKILENDDIDKIAIKLMMENW